MDGLIRAKEELIRLLGEYRQSVVADLTTGVKLPGAKTTTESIWFFRTICGYQTPILID